MAQQPARQFAQRPASPRFVKAVAAQVTTRLHPGAAGSSRCRCGACRHVILVAARRSGIEPQRLIDALPPEVKPRQRERDHRRTLSAQVSSSMAVISAGRRLDGPQAVLAVLGRIQKS